MGASLRRARDLTGRGVPVGMRLEALARGDWSVLVVTGELDLFSAPILRERVAALPASRSVALDLSGVSFVDSSGLSVVIGANKHVQASGGRFALVAPVGAPLTRLLCLAGLDRILPRFSTLDELEVVS